MTDETRTTIERYKYLPYLFGSGLSFIGAVVASAQAASPHTMLAAGAAAAGSGTLSWFLGELHKSFHDTQKEGAVRRNHLIRRGMAEALRLALIEAEDRFGQNLPKEVRRDVFQRWPKLLSRADSDDEVIDWLFPLESNEFQWNLLNRYHDVLPSSERAQLLAFEEEDQDALSSLLLRFPVGKQNAEFASISANSHATLANIWPVDEARSFAGKLLPLYRIHFATVFSRGGEITEAVGLKQHKFDRKQLEEVLAGISELFGQFKELGDKIDRLPTTDEMREVLREELRDAQDRRGLLESLPSKDNIEADLKRYRDWFAGHYKFPKFLSADLDAEQTVHDLPELSASVPKKAFSAPSKISRTAIAGQADKTVLQTARDTNLDLKVGDILAMVTTDQACGYSFTTPGYALVGEAGLGKSSLVRRLALESIDKNCVPILIDSSSWYRSVEDEKHERDKSLLKYINGGLWLPDELSDSTNPFLYGISTGYKVVLILDGWDEVGDKKLKAAELRNLLSRRDGWTTIVIATRPENFESIENMLVPIELGRISTEDCINYIQRYVPAARTDISLENSIISSPYIGNGLLLTLVVLSCKGQVGTIELKNQAAIFEKYFASPSSRFLEEIKREDPKNKKALLFLFQLLAYHATIVYEWKTQTCGRPVFPKEWVYQCAEYIIALHPQFTKLNPEDIAKFAIESSSILAVLGDNVKFSHASLQDYYCGRAVVEYEKEKNEIATMSNGPSERGTFNSPAVDGVQLVNGFNSKYQPNYFESAVWVHRIRSLRGLLGAFVESWTNYLERELDDWLLWDIEYALKIIERVGDPAYVPLLEISLRIWSDPSKFPQGAVMKIYPYNAVAQLCVLNKWDDVSTRMLASMSPDDIQLLIPGIAGPLRKAFPRDFAYRERLQAMLVELLGESAQHTSKIKYRLLEVASFLEDYMERIFFEPVGLWGDHAEKLEITRDAELLRLFTVAARSNRFSAKLAPAADELLKIYLQDGITMTPEEGLYAPEALAGCVRCLATHNDQLVGMIDNDSLELLVARAMKFRDVFSADMFREFLAELARTIPYSQVEDILIMMSKSPFEDGSTVANERLELLSEHEQTAWVLI